MATSVTMLDPNGVARQIPADQKDAALKAGGKVAVKMLDPQGTARWVSEDHKDAALAAGGKLADTPTQVTTTPPSPPQSPLITAGEGQYQMHTNGGESEPVSYSHVLDAIDKGYNFVDRATLDKFARDHVADPNSDRHRFDAQLQKMSRWNPLRTGAESIESVMDLLAGTGKEALKTFTAFDRPSTSKLETELQLAADTPMETTAGHAGELGEQVGELAVVPESKLAEIPKVGKVAKTVLTVAEQGARAAAEQGAQAYVKSGGDTEQAKSAAEVGGVLGGLTPFAKPLIEKAGQFGLEVERFFNKVSDIHTGKVVRETMNANDEITAKAEAVRAENAKKVADAEDAYKKKVDAAKAKYDDAVAARKSAEEKAALKQEQAETQAKLDHEHAVEKARLEHEQAVADQQELEAKRGVARRAELETRSRLAARLQTIRDAAVAYFKKNYDEVEKIVGDRSVPMTDLAEAVDEARQKIEGSDESIKVFNDITKKMHGVEKAEKASGLTEHELESLSPDELESLHKEGGAPQSVNFGDLKGYYSELGRMLGSESVPGDVKQAVVALRNSIDDMQERLAKDAGVGTRYKLLRDQYRNYARGFLDYQGPKGEASAVAKAVRKNDAFNATKDFPKMEPEELSRTKQILAGSPTDASTQWVEGDILTPSGKKEPAWRYRKDSTKLLDNFLRATREADALDAKAAKAKPVGEFVPPEYKPPKLKEPKEQKPIGEFVPPEKPPVKGLKKEPQPTVMTPEKLRKLKEDALVGAATVVNRFGIYMAAGGLIGGVTQLVRTGDPLKAAEGMGTGMAVGIGGGAVAPYLLARLVDKDDVIKALSRVTDKDLVRLAKLPARERAEVSETLKALAEEAQRKGKLAKPSPWLRILAGTAGRKASQPTPISTDSGASEQDIQKDLDRMQEAVPQ